CGTPPSGAQAHRRPRRRLWCPCTTSGVERREVSSADLAQGPARALANLVAVVARGHDLERGPRVAADVAHQETRHRIVVAVVGQSRGRAVDEPAVAAIPRRKLDGPAERLEAVADPEI